MKIGWNKSWKAIFSLVALATLVVTPQTAQATAIADVSAGELSGMQQLYAVSDNQWDFNDAYLVDNSGAIATGSFTRVAYYVELGPTGNTDWVWASMDTFNPDPLLVGVPRAGTGIVENGTLVSNLNVESNHPNVTPGTGADGIIEFWASNYNANGGGAFGSNDGLFDWKDSGGSSGGGHGSFQVFEFTNPGLTAATTVFGITANGGAGIGDQPGHPPGNSPDWTFGPGTGTYAVRNLEIWVGTPLAVPEPSSLAIALLGLVGVGCCCWRRRKLVSCRKLSVAMVVAVSCMLATSLNAQVVNGNFEDTSNGGLGTGAWVLEDAAIFNNGGFGSTPPLVSQDAGTRLMTLQNGNNGGRIAQDVPTTPGSFYELSFYHNNLDNEGVQASGVQSITWSVGPAGSEIVGPTSFAYPDHVGAGVQLTYGWTQQTEVFQAAAAATRIAFEGTPDSSGGFWGIQLDAVSLTETQGPVVPEPSAMVLGCFVAVGAVMFGWRRRRRRVA